MRGREDGHVTAWFQHQELGFNGYLVLNVSGVSFYHDVFTFLIFLGCVFFRFLIVVFRLTFIVAGRCLYKLWTVRGT